MFLKLLNKYFCLGFLFISLSGISQDVFIHHDLNKIHTYKTITATTFTPLTSTINDGFNNGLYWLKINNLKHNDYTVQIPNSHITKVKAYQEDSLLKISDHEKFITFRTQNTSPVYVRIDTDKEAYIPLNIKPTTLFNFEEKKTDIFNGIYYGFALVIAITNLFYFLNFKDTTFLFYALFHVAITISFVYSDGIFKLLGMSREVSDILLAVDHTLAAIFGALFATNYLQIKNYKSKLAIFTFGYTMLLIAILLSYIGTSNFYLFIVLETMAFSLVSIYWIKGVLLFKKNMFIKLFVIAYVFILLLGIDFYLLKLYGISFININASHVKIAGYLEMLLLSYAVIYRMKILRHENEAMRNSLNGYIQELELLSQELKQEKSENKNHFEDPLLSFRENEILQLIGEGKSNKEIAETLHISINTVKFHIKNLYEKLGINSRKEVLTIATPLKKQLIN
ncbi:LuxR C-terminal-related transcriptional regulator [Snuella sedimenti]|uniref:HTH luxR-type domain-containing protein n=1 Tax=Snuella sedimenti TaxID=2798802 RepID=A0A8J7LPH6_9FLAO|nr:LuxR C-terminal-related transcriptional regulator [Snuella sedimenti]MBJ6369373.1 hypothetical protein [Snuella sedimenti]